jgi:hypothetical protein
MAVLRIRILHSGNPFDAFHTGILLIFHTNPINQNGNSRSRRRKRRRKSTKALIFGTTKWKGFWL